MSLKEAKDAYIGKLKVQLDEWSADIDALEAKGKQVDTDLRGKYQDKAEYGFIVQNLPEVYRQLKR